MAEKPLYNQDVTTIIAELNTDGQRGLSTQEAAMRLAENGPNLLK